MNPNPVFKVKPLFDAIYLTNGYIYGHSYYRRRIKNRIQAFKCYHFQRPSVTCNPHLKVTIVFCVSIFDTIVTFKCGLEVTMAVSVAILEIFSVKEWPDLEIRVWGPSRSLRMAAFDRPRMTLLVNQSGHALLTQVGSMYS